MRSQHLLPACCVILSGILILVLCAVCAPVRLFAHRTYYPQGAGEAAQLVRRFQDIAVRSMRDVSSNRSLAIDLYWQAYEMASRRGTVEEMERTVGELYTKLEGGRIARARLISSGWENQGPTETVVLTRGRICENLLLVLTNETSERHIFSVSGETPEINIHAESVSLAAGASTAVYVSMWSGQVGRVLASLRVASDDQMASVPFTCEVRVTGRLAARLLDADGELTPARVYLQGSDGFNHAPEGSIDRAMFKSGEHFFYADSLVQADLPEGKAEIEAVKGFDYFPLNAKVEITSAKTTWLELRFKRLEDMNARGWYSGDEHIHGNYRGEQFITAGDNLLMIRAEDLNVGNIMVSNSGGGQIHDEPHFEGKLHALSTRDYLLYWNQEMRNQLYGHLILLNLKELVRPIYTGFPGTPHWEDYPSNYHQARKAKDQGGYAAYAHPTLVFDRLPQYGSGARASVVDVALGAIDALEVFTTHNETSMDLWYKFLNCGFKLGIAAGTDAFINHSFALLPGGQRVYVYTGGEFTYARWIEGLSRGRAFATAGPLLFFEVEDRPPGEEFNFQSPVSLKLTATASSWIPMTRLEIVRNGEIVEAVSSEVPTGRLQWKGTIQIADSAWVGARVWGPAHRLIANLPSRFAERRSKWILLAHSGIFYVHIGDSPIFAEKDRSFFIRSVDHLAEEVKTRGKFSAEERRREVLDTFLRARRVYEEMPKGRGKKD